MQLKKSRTFSDIDLLFRVHPRTKDIVTKTDEDAIKASVVNLIRTIPYERPFHPEIGSQVYALLFENFTPLTEQVASRTIFDVLTKFEPRVILNAVNVTARPDNHELDISIEFRIINSEKPIVVKTTLTRLR